MAELIEVERGFARISSPPLCKPCPLCGTHMLIHEHCISHPNVEGRDCVLRHYSFGLPSSGKDVLETIGNWNDRLRGEVQAERDGYARGQSEAAAALATMQAREAEVARMKRQIGDKDRALHEKNLALDAMGWVWCDGGCKGGTGRFTDFQLTEEHVAMMERQAKRARSYLGNKDYRAASNQERVR